MDFKLGRSWHAACDDRQSEDAKMRGMITFHMVLHGCDWIDFMADAYLINELLYYLEH